MCWRLGSVFVTPEFIGPLKYRGGVVRCCAWTDVTERIINPAKIPGQMALLHVVRYLFEGFMMLRFGLRFNLVK